MNDASTHPADPSPTATGAAGRPEREDPLVAARKEKLARWREEAGISGYGHRVDGLIPLAEARGRFDAAAHEARVAAVEAAGGDEAAAADGRPMVLVAGR